MKIIGDKKMRRKIFSVISGLLALVLLMIPNMGFAAGWESKGITTQTGQIENFNPNDAYNFPLKPRTEEWIQAWTNLDSHAEMLKMCQIPEDIVRTMSTAGLVETVLNFPFSVDWWSYSSPQEGINTVATQFNGLPELFAREDAGIQLLAKYQSVNIFTIDKTWAIARQTEQRFGIANVEILLGHDSVLSRLTSVQKEYLISTARERYQLKQQYNYGKFNQEITASLINKAAQRQYSARDYLSYVYTPCNSLIEVTKGKTEFDSETISGWNDYYESEYPTATFVANSSNTYNCFAYAWYYQGAQENWMAYYSQEGENVSKYWTDGSYSRYMYTPVNGLRANYLNSFHCAIVYDASNNKLISKWAHGPVMIHTPNNCLYNGSSIYYYYRN
jgi:hypothetical protein